MQQQAIEPGAIPEKKPTSGKTAKALTGCGGCGCAAGLVSLFAGGIMLLMGLTDSKVDELVAPGAGVLGLSVLIGFFGAALLIGGIVAMRKAKKAEEAPPPAAPVQPGPAVGTAGQPVPQQAPPQQPPPQQMPPQQPPPQQQPQQQYGTPRQPGQQPGGLPPWTPGKPGGGGPQST